MRKTFLRSCKVYRALSLLRTALIASSVSPLCHHFKPDLLPVFPDIWKKQRVKIRIRGNYIEQKTEFTGTIPNNVSRYDGVSKAFTVAFRRKTSEPSLLVSIKRS
jgi:hypothetical protein